MRSSANGRSGADWLGAIVGVGVLLGGVALGVLPARGATVVDSTRGIAFEVPAHLSGRLETSPGRVEMSESRESGPLGFSLRYLDVDISRVVASWSQLDGRSDLSEEQSLLAYARRKALVSCWAGIGRPGSLYSDSVMSVERVSIDPQREVIFIVCRYALHEGEGETHVQSFPTFTVIAFKPTEQQKQVMEMDCCWCEADQPVVRDWIRRDAIEIARSLRAIH